MGILDPKEEELESYEEEEIGIGKEIRSSSSSWFRGLLTAVLLILLVIGSFWLSFFLGKKLLVPIKPLPEAPTLPKEEMVTPEAITAEAPVFIHERKTIEIPLTKPEEKPKPKAVAVPAAGTFYKVQAGAFKNKENALNLSEKLQSEGFETFVGQKGEF